MVSCQARLSVAVPQLVNTFSAEIWVKVNVSKKSTSSFYSGWFWTEGHDRNVTYLCINLDLLCCCDLILFWVYIHFQPPAVQWNPGTEVIALYNFVANSREDLEFKRRDILTIVRPTRVSVIRIYWYWDVKLRFLCNTCGWHESLYLELNVKTFWSLYACTPNWI